MEIVKQNVNFFLIREQGFSFVFLFAFIVLFFGQSSFASKQNAGLSAESTTVEKQNAGLSAESTTVEKQNAGLSAESTTVEKQNAGLSAESTTVEKQNAGLSAESATVEQLNSSPAKDPIQTVNVSNDKIKNPNQKQQDAKEKVPSYSFRPLLIQGKKRLIQKTKDMRVDSGDIAESKLFFIDIDFKKRIFGYEEER